RPAVIDLPEEIRKGYEEREQRAGRQPPREEQPALRGEEESHTESDDEEGDRVLVEEAEAGDEAERQPVPRVLPPHHPDRDPGAGHPEERLERIHREDALEGEVDRRDQDRDGGGELGEAAAPELAGDPAGEEHEQG